MTFFKKFDWLLFGSAMVLSAFGLASMYSTSLGAQGASGDFGNFWKQLAFVGAGALLTFIVAAFDYRQLSPLSKVLYAACILLLGGVLLFGTTVRGARSWFGFGGFGIQPVEVVKVLLIVYLAKFFSDYARDPGGLKQIFGSGAALAVVLLLVLAQPDFGSGFLLAATWGALLLVSGIRRSHLLVIVLLCVVTAVVSWFFLLQDYQKARITAFTDPAADPQGRGYNVAQAMIAIGSGGFTGKGLGFGSQSQLRFLPERQTDFIFAVVAEELGFLGVTMLVGMFGIFFWRGYVLAVQSRDDFTMFLVLGLMVSIAVEVFVNIGANLRLLPVTGVTLPFVSYGGSSVLAKFAIVGILESVAVRR